MPAHARDRTLRARAGLHRRRGRGRREAGAVGGIPRHKDREAEGRARGFLCDRQAVNPPAENQFVVPPLGRKRRIQTHSVTPDACGLKAGLRTTIFVSSWLIFIFQPVRARTAAASVRAKPLRRSTKTESNPNHAAIVHNSAANASATAP